MVRLTSLLFILAAFACNPQRYHVQQTENPAFRTNRLFFSYENVALPRFDSLRIRYHLDTIVKNETDEFKRILLLRNWIRETIPNEDHKAKYSGDGYPDRILDAALKGEGFHCAHYMAVQNAIMNAFGYVTRCIGSGPGEGGAPDQHHGINEIWSNTYRKWFLSDAKYNHHFEKNGVPLSALEVRAAYLKDGAAGIDMVKGPERKKIDVDPFYKRSRGSFARTYSWIEWNVYNDRFSSWPNPREALIVYQDEFAKKNTWMWDGRPHWAYNTAFMKFTDAAGDIEWTPNTISSQVELRKDTAVISLTSITPNFSEYQMRRNQNDGWRKCNSVVALPLKNKEHAFYFRAVNTKGVAGPEHQTLIVSK